MSARSLTDVTWLFPDFDAENDKWSQIPARLTAKKADPEQVNPILTSNQFSALGEGPKEQDAPEAAPPTYQPKPILVPLNSEADPGDYGGMQCKEQVGLLLLRKYVKASCKTLWSRRQPSSKQGTCNTSDTATGPRKS